MSGRLVDIDALTMGGLEALANERGLRLITKEAYDDLRRVGLPDGLDNVLLLSMAIDDHNLFMGGLEDHGDGVGCAPDCAGDILARYARLRATDTERSGDGIDPKILQTVLQLDIAPGRFWTLGKHAGGMTYNEEAEPIARDIVEAYNRRVARAALAATPATPC